MTTIRILTDTGTRIAIEGLGDEKIDEYKQGFAANAPGATLSFELAADRWWLFPLHRVVAMQCLPDISEDEASDRSDPASGSPIG